MARRLIASCMLLGIIFSRNAWAQETPAPLPAPTNDPLPAGPATATPAAPDAPAAPSAGHVYVPKLTPRSKAKTDETAPAETGDAPAASEPQTTTDADDDVEPTTGPVRGFMMEARLSQPLASGGVAHGAIGAAPGAPPIAALGYRTDRAGVLFGPSVSHYGGDTGIATTTVGLSFHVEIAVARTDDRVNEGYIVAAVSLANTSFDSDTLSSAIAGSVAVGFGARHWATRHLAFGVELGEGYADTATTSANGVTYTGSYGGYTPAITYKVTRVTGLDTFGALTAAVVF